MTQLCQTLHSHIQIHDARVKANLLSKTLCAGLGSYLRTLFHCACTAKSFRLTIGCASDGFRTESRPCVECGINTCDECRIHVFYNHLVEDAGYDQRRWWAGFFFLNTASISVLPPKHGDVSAWYRPIEEMEPLHDRGRFHIPLHIPAIGDPEPIERLLDINLGEQQIISPLGRTQPPYSGNEIVSFLNMIITLRKELVCLACFKERQKKGSSRCSCTLRKRFLDRWLCVGCYVKEDHADKAMASHIVVQDDDGGGHRHLCACGASFGAGPQPKILCNWCKGEVAGEWVDAENEMEDRDAEEPEEEEQQDEEHSAADFAHMEPGELGFAKNCDKSLSVYVDGTCIRGERLGRGIVRKWRLEEGLPDDCICCLCEDGDANHNHNHDGNDGEGNDDGDERGTNENSTTAIDDDESN